MNAPLYCQPRCQCVAKGNNPCSRSLFDCTSEVWWDRSSHYRSNKCVKANVRTIVASSLFVEGHLPIRNPLIYLA